MKRFLFLCLVSLFVFPCMSACKKQEKAPQPLQESEKTAAEEKNVAEACTYSADPKEIKMEWTAYKYTNKTAVKGTFTSRKITGPLSARSFGSLVLGLRMDIDGATLEAGDPARNVTVRDFFFKEFNPPFQLSARVSQFQGDESRGNMMVDITMNSVTKSIPFAYTVSPEGVLTAKSGIDLMNFNLKKAFDSIHQACEQMHTGEDGISKTWADVDLMITGKFTKACPGS